jgi:hypothetical protein
LIADNGPAETKVKASMEWASKFARYSSMAGAALALGAIVWLNVWTRQAESRIQNAEADLRSIKANIRVKQLELADNIARLEQAKTELAVEQDAYQRLKKKLPAGAAEKAIQEAVTANPQSASLPPVVYIYIARPDQGPLAKSIQLKLRAIGCQVPSIDPGGKDSTNNSYLRYFVPTDEKVAKQSILPVLQSLNANISAQYLGPDEGTPTALRPNQYELWLGRNLKP